MDELRDLYQEVILDHSKSPRNFHAMSGATHSAEGYNPLCGDKVTIYVDVEDDVVKSVSFKGQGCAISTASASLLTESLVGKSVQQAQELFDRIHELMTGESDEMPDELGKLAVFSGVRDYPMRVKCATLAWHTLVAALQEQEEPVTTE